MGNTDNKNGKNNKWDRRNNNQQNNQQNSQKPVEAPADVEVATLEDVAADIEMMDADAANAYYATYEDMETAIVEMMRCNVPTTYVSQMAQAVLDLMEIKESQGGLIRTKADVDAEIANMEAIANSANETLGMSINLYEDDTPAGKKFRELFQFDENAPENQSEGGREVLIPKANEAALDQIFMEWAALSLTGYNAIATDDKGNTSWLYNGIYDSVDAMYPQEG